MAPLLPFLGGATYATATLKPAISQSARAIGSSTVQSRRPALALGGPRAGARSHAVRSVQRVASTPVLKDLTVEEEAVQELVLEQEEQEAADESAEQEQEQGAQALEAKAIDPSAPAASTHKATCEIGVQADIGPAAALASEASGAAVPAQQAQHGAGATPEDDVEAQLAAAAHPQPLSAYAASFVPTASAQQQQQQQQQQQHYPYYPAYAASHNSSSDAAVSAPYGTYTHAPSYSYAASEYSAPPSVVASSYVHRTPKDHNSVTIKHDTKVKDAAGAIFKVIDRLGVAFVTALRVEPTHEALNRAVKSIAVARKYVQDTVAGFEVTFLPLHRQDRNDTTRPDLFAFLVSKTRVGAAAAVAEGESTAVAAAASCLPGSASAQLAALKMADETDLNVSRSSDVNKMANAIISIVLDREQAVMKAGGAEAVFVAMSAVINARRRLQARRGADLMLVPTFITEDTKASLGRESKFLRFNIMRCEPNGPKSDVHPSLSSYEGPVGRKGHARESHDQHHQHQHYAPAFAGAM